MSLFLSSSSEETLSSLSSIVEKYSNSTNSNDGIEISLINDNSSIDLIDALKSITISIENDIDKQTTLGEMGLIEMLIELLSFHNKKPVSDADEDTSNNPHDLSTEDNWKLSLLTGNYNKDIDNIADWANVRDNIIWLLVKLCRRSLDKTTANISNVEKIAIHIDLLVATFWVCLNSESGSLASCWLVMILASDSNERQRALGKSKASEIIIAMMHRYKRIPLNAEYSCRATRNLAADDDVAAQLVDDGICDVIASLININNENYEVSLAALWSVINLSCDSNIATLLGTAGCCDAIVNASFKVIADHEGNNIHYSYSYLLLLSSFFILLLSKRWSESSLLGYS
jgi:hypothetical protein